MKKAILVFILFHSIFSTATMYAQEKRDFGKFDFEMGFDLSADRDNSIYNLFFPIVYMEGRWQSESRPVDIGFRWGTAFVERDNGEPWAVHLLAVGDYQFGRGKKLNPYAGLGAGMLVSSTEENNGTTTKGDFAISPRVGIRCFKFLNIAANYMLTHKDYTRFYFNLGFYF